MTKKERVGLNRLLKLADFLENLPPEKFNYNVWVGAAWRGKPDLSCGTSACAIGWASTMPLFRKLGLRLNKLRRLPGFLGADGKVRVYDGLPYKAAGRVGKRLFHITEEEASYLFIPNENIWDDNGNVIWDGIPGYSTAKQVGQHIRDFVMYKERQ